MHHNLPYLITCIFIFCFVSAFGQVIDRDQSKILKDQVIPDDLIVLFSACVGSDCVNGESFGFSTIKLKENNLRIEFDDTSESASFPGNDWQITINDSANGGKNKFSIDDKTSGRTPFTILAGAPGNSLFVRENGNLGLGTSTPAVEVHIKDGDSPTLRLEQDGSSGFGQQSWDIAGNETNFFIRDATNGSKLPFKIKPGAPDNAIFIKGDGFVGLGTANPQSKLHVVGDIAKTGSIIGVSDKSVKENIKSIDNALEIINDLDGKSFEFKRNKYPELNLPAGTHYGLIAQDVEKVISNLIKHGFMKVTDENGNEEYLKGIKYEEIIAILINAMKEQNKSIAIQGNIINSQDLIISELLSKFTSTEERLSYLEEKLIIISNSRSLENTNLKK